MRGRKWCCDSGCGASKEKLKRCGVGRTGPRRWHDQLLWSILIDSVEFTSVISQVAVITRCSQATDT